MFVNAAKAMCGTSSPPRPSFFASYKYSFAVKTTPSFVVTRLLEILLPLLLHLFIILVIALIYSSRCTRAAIIRSLDTLAFLRQHSLDMGEELDQGIELFDRE